MTYRQPDRHMRIRGIPCTPQILLIAKRLHNDGIVERALARSVERLHVEDVDALHFTQDLETLETGRLFQICRDGAGRGAGGEEVGFALDLWVRGWGSDIA